MALTGNDVGPLKVLQTVCSLMVDAHSKNEIATLVHTYWHRHTAIELLAEPDSLS